MFMRKTRFLSALLAACILISMLACFAVPAMAEAESARVGLVDTSDMIDLKTVTVYKGSVDGKNKDGSPLTASQKNDRTFGEWTEELGNTPDNNKGTYYKITDRAGLERLAEIVATYTCSMVGNYVYLANDIDMEWVNFKGIGQTGSSENGNYAFKGTFDGNGFVIKNLLIDQPAHYRLGLFNHYYGGNGGVIRNVGIANGLVIGGVKYTGTATNDNFDGVGSLVGDCWKGKVENCWSAATVISSCGAPVGGLIGRSYRDSTAAVMNNCYFLGTVNSAADTATYGLGGEPTHITASSSYILGQDVTASSLNGTGLANKGLQASYANQYTVQYTDHANGYPVLTYYKTGETEPYIRRAIAQDPLSDAWNLNRVNAAGLNWTVDANGQLAVSADGTDQIRRLTVTATKNNNRTFTVYGKNGETVNLNELLQVKNATFVAEEGSIGTLGEGNLFTFGAGDGAYTTEALLGNDVEVLRAVYENDKAFWDLKKVGEALAELEAAVENGTFTDQAAMDEAVDRVADLMIPTTEEKLPVTMNRGATTLYTGKVLPAINAATDTAYPNLGIYTVADLQAITADNSKGRTFYLCADLNLKNVQLASLSFYGNLDGQNHTVRNLTKVATGLFGEFYGSYIKDLVFEFDAEQTVTQASGYSGYLCGTVHNAATIDNIIVRGGTFATSNAGFGLIACRAVKDLTVSNILVEGCTFKFESNNTGVIMGRHYYTSTVTLKNVSVINNHCEVKKDSTSMTHSWLVGSLDDNNVDPSIATNNSTLVLENVLIANNKKNANSTYNISAILLAECYTRRAAGTHNLTMTNVMVFGNDANKLMRLRSNTSSNTTFNVNNVTVSNFYTDNKVLTNGAASTITDMTDTYYSNAMSLKNNSRRYSNTAYFTNGAAVYSFNTASSGMKVALDTNGNPVKPAATAKAPYRISIAKSSDTKYYYTDCDGRILSYWHTNLSSWMPCLAGGYTYSALIKRQFTANTTLAASDHLLQYTSNEDKTHTVSCARTCGNYTATRENCTFTSADLEGGAKTQYTCSSCGYTYTVVNFIPVTGVTLEQASCELDVGESKTLQATVLPADADDQSMTWASSDPSVVKVEEGVITALAPGEATVTVYAGNGAFSDTCTVTVPDPKLKAAVALLDAEIGYAEELKAELTLSEEAEANVPFGTQYVSAGQMAAFEEALNGAKTADRSTVSTVEECRTALKTAVATLKKGIRIGQKITAVVADELKGDFLYAQGVRLKAYQLASLEGDIYFVNDSHRILRNARVYLTEQLANAAGLPVGYYYFNNEGKLDLKNGPVDGYFYRNGEQLKAYQLAEYEGYYYYVGDAHRLAKNVLLYLPADLVKNTELAVGYYYFDAEGKLRVPNGPVGDYFYRNGQRLTAYQLVKFEDHYYFINDGHRLAKNTKLYMTSATLEGTGLPADYYEFDAEGKMLLRNGPVGDYFWREGIRLDAYQLAEFEGYYYFINDYHRLAKSCRLYLTEPFLEGTGLPVGYYDFDTEGKMLLKNGLVDGFFWRDGIRLDAYQLVEFEGEYYYIGDGHRIVTDKRIYLNAEQLKGTDYPAGYYSFYTDGRMIRSDRLVRVPNLSGMTREEAANALAALELKVSFTETNYTLKVPEGTVVSQAVAAKSIVPKGATLSVTVIGAPKGVEVPDLSYMTLEEATAALEALELKVTSETVSYHLDYEVGAVVDQSKLGLLLQGSTVTLALNGKPQMITVPDFYRMSVAEAEAAAKQAGLRVAYAEGFDPKAESMGILTQSASAGEQLLQGSTVTLDGKLMLLNPLTVAAANIGIFVVSDGSAQYKAFAEHLREFAPEIVAYARVDKNAERTNQEDQIKLMAEEAGYSYHHFGKLMDVMRTQDGVSVDKGDYGIGLMSKFPIQCTTTIFEANELDYGATSYEERGYIRAEVDLGTETVAVYSAWFSGNANCRKAQLAELMAVMEKDERAILAGIFSGAPSTYADTIPEGYIALNDGSAANVNNYNIITTDNFTPLTDGTTAKGWRQSSVTHNNRYYAYSDLLMEGIDAPETVKIPNFVGMSKAEAEAAAKEAGVKVVFSEKYKANKVGVYLQSVPAGAELIKDKGYVTLTHCKDYSDHVKVVSYNIHHLWTDLSGNSNSSNETDRTAAVIKILKDLDADIVCLQEVDVNCTRSGKVNQPQFLAEALGYPYHEFTHVHTLTDGGHYGTAILSRYEILEAETVLFNSSYQAAEKRGYGRFTLDVNGSEVVVFNTHITTTKEYQYNQMQEISGAMQAYIDLPGDQYTILTGDMNMNIGKIAPHLNLETVTPLNGGKDLLGRSSCNIDHIVVSDTFDHYEEINGLGQLYVNDIGKSTSASDHNPVYTFLKIDESKGHSGPLKVANRNIARCKIGDTYNYEFFINELKKMDADIVGLQRVEKNMTMLDGEYVDQTEYLAKAAGYPYSHFFCNVPQTTGEYGIALLSKYPLVEITEKLFKDQDTTEKRGFIKAKVDLGAGHFVTVYTANASTMGEAYAIPQMEEIFGLMEADPYPIFVGMPYMVPNQYREVMPENFVALNGGKEYDHILTGPSSVVSTNIVISDRFTPIADNTAPAGFRVYENSTAAHRFCYADLILPWHQNEDVTTVPDLRGKTVAEAKAALTEAGLTMGVASTGYSPNYKVGEIFYQSLEHGTATVKNNTVNVQYSADYSGYLKVASYNVKCFGHSAQYEEIAAEIKAIDADVVLLQEVDKNTSRNPQDQMAVIAELTGYPYYKFTQAHETISYGHGILSKYPIDAYTRNIFGSQNDKGGEQRTYSRFQVTVNGVTYTIYNTHLALSPDADTNKTAATTQLKEILDRAANDDYPIICGDMNAKGQYIRNVIDTAKFTSLNGGEKYDAIVYTYPQGTGSRLDIDHIIVGKDLTYPVYEATGAGLNVNVTDRSDHNMVYTCVKPRT